MFGSRLIHPQTFAALGHARPSQTDMTQTVTLLVIKHIWLQKDSCRYLAWISLELMKTYASVVCHESLSMSLAIAATNNIETWQVDYVAAYLNSKLQVDIYIELPDGAKIQGKIGKLNRTLYRTMDGAYNWWEDVGH